MRIISVILYIILAPLIGGLLSGIDRKVSARMQGRKGPPLLQPFYDVTKLLVKQIKVVNRAANLFVGMFLAFVIFTGMIFFYGSDILLMIFALTLSNVFLVLAAFSTNSPYSSIGAERELVQMMAYEPMLMCVGIGFYMASGTFRVVDLLSSWQILQLPGLFIGFIFILTIKLRKSPFDLSTSHHGHQEIVKGITTEFAGPTLAAVEIGHWYENVILMGLLFLFFRWDTPAGIIIGTLTCVVTYFVEILIDNCFARVKWKNMMTISWILVILLAFVNLLVLSFIK